MAIATAAVVIVRSLKSFIIDAAVGSGCIERFSAISGSFLGKNWDVMCKVMLGSPSTTWMITLIGKIGNHNKQEHTWLDLF